MSHVTPQQEEAALAIIAPAAVESQRRTSVPAEITVGQCIIESGWLQKESGKNNYFGIKVDGHGCGEADVATHEYENGIYTSEQCEFETYDTLADGFADHARLVSSGRYRGEFERYLAGRNIDLFMDGIEAAGYAPGSPGYSARIKEIYKQSNVQAALAKAR